MLGQAVDLDFLVLLAQEHPQLVSQSRQVPGDLSYRGQMQVAPPLVVGVYGQVLGRSACDVVLWRRKFEGDCRGCARLHVFQLGG